MNATEARPETAGGHVDRRDLLRGAAAIVAGGVALASRTGIVAQADEQARAVDERFFPGFRMCEDYRAAASIDLVHDEADLDEKIQCPLLVLWGERGSVARRYDALAIWGERAARLSGKQMPDGHSFHESHPQETAAELRAFLSA